MAAAAAVQDGFEFPALTEQCSVLQQQAAGPEAAFVVHSHDDDVSLFAATRQPVLPLNQDSMMFYGTRCVCALASCDQRDDMQLWVDWTAVASSLWLRCQVSKETLRPCPLHLHVISLMPRVQVCVLGHRGGPGVRRRGTHSPARPFCRRHPKNRLPSKTRLQKRPNELKCPRRRNQCAVWRCIRLTQHWFTFG